MNGYRVALLALLATGCGASVDDGTIDACVGDNPPAVPFDVGTASRAQPAPAPGETPIVLPPPTAEDIAVLCREGGGSGCDAATFISKDAATCIAQGRGLAQGLRPWDVSLNYYGNHRRVGWGIMTVTTETTVDGYSGEAMVLDAITGGELSRTVYRAIP